MLSSLSRAGGIIKFNARHAFLLSFLLKFMKIISNIELAKVNALIICGERRPAMHVFNWYQLLLALLVVVKGIRHQAWTDMSRDRILKAWYRATTYILFITFQFYRPMLPELRRKSLALFSLTYNNSLPKIWLPIECIVPNLYRLTNADHYDIVNQVITFI